MAGTVTADLYTISLCESPYTGWTNVGTGTGGLNDITVFDSIQGSYCYQDYKASAANRGQQWDFGATTPVDFSSATNYIVIFWFAFSKKNYGSNPMRIRVTDTSGNYSEWNMFTASQLPHPSWIPWVLKPTTTPDTTNGTLNLTSVRYVDWRCDTVAAKTYVYWDAVRYGTGLSIYAGTSGSPATFEDFATAESTNAYGIVNKYKGVYYVQGQLKFGSSGSSATYFKDTGKTIIFQDSRVDANFYKIFDTGNSNNDTEIYFGSKSGSSGVQGCTFQRETSSQTAYFNVDLSSTTRTKLGLYGSTLRDAGTLTLPSYDASYTREMLNCAVISSLKVIASSCTVRNTNFISTSDTTASLKWNNSIDIEDCQFIANTTGAAIEHNDWNGSVSGNAENTGSETTVLIDTGAFASGVSINDYVYNETDQSFGRVTSIDSNDQITHTALSGGTNNYWSMNDVYSIATAYSYTNLTFSGNTYDVDNTTSPANVVAISKAGTSNPITYPSGDFVVIQGSVTITVHVVDKDNNDINLAQTAIYLNNGTELLNTDTDSSGMASTTYAGSTPVSCYIRVRKSSPGDTRYIANSTTGTIASGTGLDVTVVLQEDTNT